MTIISLRGTHGSGKSSVVRKILDKYTSIALNMTGRNSKPEGYAVDLPTGWMYVRGPYHTACGGCDAIQPYADIWPMIERRIEFGVDAYGRQINFVHCLFEGALVSSGYGNLGRSTEKYGDDVVFAFLDTPLELCLERIAARRATRWATLGKPGAPPPVNPKNTTEKYGHVLKSITQIAELGRRTAMIRHTHAVKDTLALLGVKITREPT